ncbi:hypothetical protein STEG23_019668, partial [Scotinomys teguina]
LIKLSRSMLDDPCSAHPQKRSISSARKLAARQELFREREKGRVGGDSSQPLMMEDVKEVVFCACADAFKASSHFLFYQDQYNLDLSSVQGDQY